MDGRAKRWSEVRNICVHTASIHLSLFLALLVVMGDERASSCPAVARSGNTNNLEQPPTQSPPRGRVVRGQQLDTEARDSDKGSSSVTGQARRGEKGRAGTGTKLLYSVLHE